MPYFPTLTYDDVTNSRVKAIYEEIKADLGFGMVPNLFKSMGAEPAFLEASWIHFRRVILDGTLPRTLKEMIGVAISQANNSQYVLKVHLHGLSTLGISEEVLRLLVTDFESCPLPKRQKSVIRFAVKAATQPQQLTQADYDQLYQFNLTQPELFEIILTANLFTGLNQYTDAIDVEIDSLT